MTEGQRRMRELMARLAAAGIAESFVREHVLPDWWDDEAADTPAGFTEAVWTIAQRLGIECAALRGQEPMRV